LDQRSVVPNRDEPFARLGQQLFDEHRFAFRPLHRLTLQPCTRLPLSRSHPLCHLHWTFFFEDASSLSAAERDAKGGHDARSGEREAAKTHRDDGSEFGPGVDVILDHDLQAERSVIE
jgi:hypothetical protein